MEFVFPNRAINVPAEIILQIASHLGEHLYQPWKADVALCGCLLAGPSPNLCGPSTDADARAATRDMRAFAGTCRALRQMIGPLALGFLSVRLEQGLCPPGVEGGADEYRQRYRDIKFLRRPEGYYYSDKVLPTDRVLDIARLPFQSEYLVRSLDLRLKTWAFERRVASLGRSPAVASDEDDIQGRKGGIAVLEMYPGLRRLDLWVEYGHWNGAVRLNRDLAAAVAGLRLLSTLKLRQVSLAKGTPAMPSVRCIEVHNAHIACWDSFPNVVDIRIKQQDLFGEALLVPWDVLRRLHHFTYYPPDDIKLVNWIPDQCRKIGQIQNGDMSPEDRKKLGLAPDDERIDPLPLKELVINGPIVARHLIDMAQGLSTPSLRTFVCVCLSLHRHDGDIGREGEISAMIKKAFPNLPDNRLEFGDVSKQRLRRRRQQQQQQEEGVEASRDGGGGDYEKEHEHDHGFWRPE